MKKTFVLILVVFSISCGQSSVGSVNQQSAVSSLSSPLIYLNDLGGFAMTLPDEWIVAQAEETALGQKYHLGRAPLDSGPRSSTLIIADASKTSEGVVAEQLLCGGGCAGQVVFEPVTINGRLSAQRAIIGNNPPLTWYFIKNQDQLIYFTIHDETTFADLTSVVNSFQFDYAYSPVLGDVVVVESSLNLPPTLTPIAVAAGVQESVPTNSVVTVVVTATADNALPTMTSTPTNTLEVVAVATETATQTQTVTIEPTVTNLPSPSATAETAATQLPTLTPIPTATTRPTVTAVPTATDSPTSTSVPRETATSTPTTRPTVTATATVTPTITRPSIESIAGIEELTDPTDFAVAFWDDLLSYDFFREKEGWFSEASQAKLPIDKSVTTLLQVESFPKQFFVRWESASAESASFITEFELADQTVVYRRLNLIVEDDSWKVDSIPVIDNPN